MPSSKSTRAEVAAKPLLLGVEDLSPTGKDAGSKTKNNTKKRSSTAAKESEDGESKRKKNKSSSITAARASEEGESKMTNSNTNNVTAAKTSEDEESKIMNISNNSTAAKTGLPQHRTITIRKTKECSSTGKTKPVTGKSFSFNIDVEKIKKVKDLSSLIMTSEFFNEEQLLPPLHRLVWHAEVYYLYETYDDYAYGSDNSEESDYNQDEVGVEVGTFTLVNIKRERLDPNCELLQVLNVISTSDSTFEFFVLAEPQSGVRVPVRRGGVTEFDIVTRKNIGGFEGIDGIEWMDKVERGTILVTAILSSFQFK